MLESLEQYFKSNHRHPSLVKAMLAHRIAERISQSFGLSPKVVIRQTTVVLVFPSQAQSQKARLLGGKLKQLVTAAVTGATGGAKVIIKLQ